MSFSGQTNFIGGKPPADDAGEFEPRHSPIGGSEIGVIAGSMPVAAQQAIASARAVAGVFPRDTDPAVRDTEEMPTGLVTIDDISNYWILHISFGGVSGKGSGMDRVGGRHALAAMRDLKTATLMVR